MTFKIKHKRGPASALTSANLTLSAGELAFETDTRRFKLGDGTTAWSSLSYVTPYVTATDRILGRSSAGAGAAEEISCGSFGRSLIGSADAAAARGTLSVQPTASPAFTGRVGIGAAANAIAYVHIDQTAPSSGGVTQVIRNTVTIPSTTTDYWTFLSAPTTQAASFTLSGMRHFVVDPQGFGAGSTVTNQFGYIVESSMTGATNNYGFYSNIASGTGRWNFYANGTAPSFFGGQLLVTAGSASACGVAFSGDPDTGIAQLSAAGANTLSICTNSAERVRVGSGGNVAIGAIDPQTALHIDKNADGALVILRGAQTANTQHILFRNPFHTNNGSAGTAFVGAQDTGSSGGNLIFATTTNGSGASGTPTERMRVDASGKVGIGVTTNLTAALNFPQADSGEVINYFPSETEGVRSGVGKYSAEVRHYVPAGDFFAWRTGGPSGTERMKLSASLLTVGSSVSITASQVYSDTVGATNRDLFIDSTGKLGYVSSVRASKTNIAAIDDVSWLRDLTPVSFHYRKRNEDGTYSDEADGTLDYGLIAEEVEPVAPEMCFYDFVDGEPQLRGVHYSKLITPMLRYIQQLEARIAALEERVNA